MLTTAVSKSERVAYDCERVDDREKEREGNERHVIDVAER